MIKPNKLIFILALCLSAHSVWAQDAAAAPPAVQIPPSSSSTHPSVRPLPLDDTNRESSSFMGDSENLDPMKTKKESLKGDEEAILDDIKDVVDAPRPKPSPTAPAKKPIVRKKTITLPTKKVKPEKKLVKKEITRKPIIRTNDNPDEKIEKSFHQQFKQYNEIPTSVEAWSKATFGRSAEVYFVQKGDTLWSISETLFGDSLFWPKIWALNKQGIVNPHFIVPGMRVNFFPGDAEEVPTLAVGEIEPTAEQKKVANKKPNLKNKSQPEAEEELFLEETESDYDDLEDDEVAEETPEESEPEEVVAENNVDKTEYQIAKSKSKKTNIKSKSKIKKGSFAHLKNSGRPTRVPPSLPVYRSEVYYGKSRKVDIIELEEPASEPLTYSADVFLTDRLVLSDIKIKHAINTGLRCYVGEIIEQVEYVRNVGATEYTILQALDKVSLDKKTVLYPYQKVGTVQPLNDNKLKITECHSFLNRDQLYVPTSVVESLKTHKTSTTQPKIIGGPIVFEQFNFAQAQKVYVDMGELNFEQGQNFGIKSHRIDSVVGEIKILDKFGSYALAVITEAENSIQAGDTVLVK